MFGNVMRSRAHGRRGGRTADAGSRLQLSWALIVAGTALVLSYQLVIRGIPAAISKSSPDIALLFRPDDPQALRLTASRSLARATDALQQTLDKTPTVAAGTAAGNARSDSIGTGEPELRENVALPLTPDEQRRIHERLKGALLGTPRNAEALALLGQLAYLGGDNADPAPYMSAAMRFSPRATVAAIWYISADTQALSASTLLHYADRVLRVQPDLTGYIAPQLARMTDTAAGKAELRSVLAGNPPWRARFLSVLPQHKTDPQETLDLLLFLNSAAHPPSAQEWRVYLDFLMKQGRHELAYYAWLQYLPPDQLEKAGYLFNGDFETPTDGFPFDWQHRDRDGVTIERTRDAGRSKQHVLNLTFGPGRVQFDGVSQLLMLPSGAYKATGRLKGQINGLRGLVWRMVCDDAPRQPLGQSPMLRGDYTNWSDFALSFTVPKVGCRPQRLELFLDARSPSEKIVTGNVAFDDLSFTRLDGTNGAQAP